MKEVPYRHKSGRRYHKLSNVFTACCSNQTHKKYYFKYTKPTISFISNVKSMALVKVRESDWLKNWEVFSLSKFTSKLGHWISGGTRICYIMSTCMILLADFGLFTYLIFSYQETIYSIFKMVEWNRSLIRK